MIDSLIPFFSLFFAHFKTQITKSPVRRRIVVDTIQPTATATKTTTTKNGQYVKQVLRALVPENYFLFLFVVVYLFVAFLSVVPLRANE